MGLRCATLLPILLACIAALICPLPAQAQVKRCAMVDGTTLYTDRNCADLGAVERVPRQAPGYGVRLPYRGGCSRQLQDLIFEVSSAIDSGDANRLASVYHWPGLSSRTGYAIISRLEAMARRPLIDIRALHPATRITEVDADSSANTPPTVDDDYYYPQTVKRGPPTGLRIEQTLSDGVTPKRTTFGLRKHMGCWWISL